MVGIHTIVVLMEDFVVGFRDEEKTPHEPLQLKQFVWKSAAIEG